MAPCLCCTRAVMKSTECRLFRVHQLKAILITGGGLLYNDLLQDSLLQDGPNHGGPNQAGLLQDGPNQDDANHNIHDDDCTTRNIQG